MLPNDNSSEGLNISKRPRYRNAEIKDRGLAILEDSVALAFKSMPPPNLNLVEI